MSIKNNSRIKYTRSRCIVCGTELGEAVFKAENFPSSAQDMPSAGELCDDKGIDPELKVCPYCGLAQFTCEPVDYYRTAVRAVGLSSSMKALRRSDYEHLIEDYGLKGGKILECGCGNGDFLRLLAEYPVKACGTEYKAFEKFSYDEDLLSRSEIFDFFPERSAGQLSGLYCDRYDEKAPGSPYDCFLSFNFLEHQPDPVTMLRCMYNSLNPGGIGLITVPSLEYMIEKGSCYELIRDHIANYSLVSADFLCRMCGFEVSEKDRIGIGDTLRIIVKKPLEAADDPYPDNRKESGTIKKFSKNINYSSEELKKISKVVNCQSEREKMSLPVSVPEDEISRTVRGIENFNEDRERLCNRIGNFVSKLTGEGKSLALWGAGHQGFTVAAMTALSHKAMYIIDSSPMKQGRYAPVSHLPIISPEESLRDPADVIMITAPGYAREIEAAVRRIFADSLPGICDIEDESIR